MVEVWLTKLIQKQGTENFKQDFQRQMFKAFWSSKDTQKSQKAPWDFWSLLINTEMNVIFKT